MAKTPDDKEYCYTREFLNDDVTELGGIGVHVERNSGYVTGSIRVGDCNRTIWLDLDCSDAVAFQNRLRKLSRLRNAIELAEASLRKAFKDAEKWRKEHPKKGNS